ncbi:MAG: DUF308 domain-containing protein [Pleomorphochaeta sp.]
MKEKSFFKNNLILSMIFGIVIAIFGIILIVNGQGLLRYAVLVYGLYSVFVGVKGLIFATNLVELKRTKNVNLFSSIFSIIIGIIIIAAPYFISNLAVTIVVYLLALQLLINGLNNLFSFFGLKKTDFFSNSFLINGLINLLIAVIFFIFPNQVAQFFLRVFGVIFVFYGIGHFFWSFRLRKVEKDFEKTNVEGDFEKMN